MEVWVDGIGGGAGVDSKKVRTLGAGGMPKAYKSVQGGKGDRKLAHFEGTYFLNGPRKTLANIIQR